MRILHWYTNFLCGGGVANAVLGLATTQTRLGAEVAIATTMPAGMPLYEDMEKDLNTVNIIKWQPRWIFNVGNLVLRGVSKKAIHQIQKFNPQIVHVHGEFNPDNLWVTRLFKCPIVLSPHGAFHPEVLVKSWKLGKRIYLHLAQRLLYQRVHAFHALSPMEREHIARILPDQYIYCVPQGANIRALTLIPTEESIAYDGTVRLLFVGRLDVYTKGLDILLEAFADTTKSINRQPVILTLVGPDWRGGRPWLQLRAKILGIAGKVFFTGPLSGKEVSAILHQSDIYIHLSRHEGFGLSIAEALLAGKPAILSQDIGMVSYPDIALLSHLRIVPPSANKAAEAIVDFVQHSTELKAIAGQFQAKMKDFFSWKRIANLHLQVYEQFLRETL